MSPTFRPAEPVDALQAITVSTIDFRREYGRFRTVANAIRQGLPGAPALRSDEKEELFKLLQKIEDFWNKAPVSVPGIPAMDGQARSNAAGYAAYLDRRTALADERAALTRRFQPAFEECLQRLHEVKEWMERHRTAAAQALEAYRRAFPGTSGRAQRRDEKRTATPAAPASPATSATATSSFGCVVEWGSASSRAGAGAGNHLANSATARNPQDWRNAASAAAYARRSTPA